MENKYLQMLAQIVLPTQILDYFAMAGVVQTESEIHISLDEKTHPELSGEVHFESKGFMEAVSVTDFPIRDHKVILRIRRRRWTDTRTGKSFSIPIDLDVVAKGTRYSKEFGDFLKDSSASLRLTLPEEMFEIPSLQHRQTKGYTGVLFHPDLLCDTPLEQCIDHYPTWCCCHNALNERERQIISDCLKDSPNNRKVKKAALHFARQLRLTR